MFRWIKQRTAAKAQQVAQTLQEQAAQVQQERQRHLLALTVAAVNRPQLRAVRREALRLLLEPAPVLLALTGRKVQLQQERLQTARSASSRRSSTSRTPTARRT